MDWLAVDQVRVQHAIELLSPYNSEVFHRQADIPTQFSVTIYSGSKTAV